QTEPLRGEMLANDRHLEVGRVAAAVFGRQRQAKPACGIRPPPHLGEQLLPLLARHAAAFEICAGPLATMVEEADVVVLSLERLDVPLDEVVELDERGLNVSGNLEVHALSLGGC